MDEMDKQRLEKQVQEEYDAKINVIESNLEEIEKMTEPEQMVIAID